MVTVTSHEVPPAELRRQRKAAGLSTYGLAELLDVSAAAVQHWEAGRRPVPRGRVSDLQHVLAARAPVTALAMTGPMLRELRGRARLSQSDVAHLLGVKRQAVAGWEAGEVPEGRRDILRQALASEAPAAALMRALRDRAGWKQAELAERIGSNQSEVSSWERGAKPIPGDKWPHIRDVLAAAEPDIRPVHFQRPVTQEELREGVRRLNWTLHDLADALGVSRGAVGGWSAGFSPVPHGRRAQVREVLGTAQPTPPAAERDRVAEALALVLAVIGAEPGLGRMEVIRRVDAPEPHARAAVVRVLEQGLAHERRVPRDRADGVVRFLPGLYPGPRPAELPRVDRTALVVPEVLPAVEVQPGRTRRQVADGLSHDRRLGERAIVRALGQGLVHERGVVIRGRGSRTHVRMGLFPGAAPPAAAPIPGEVLQRLRERLGISQPELAARLGVGPGLVRNWQRSEVPAAWRQAIGQALRSVSAEADAREAGLRRRILEAVRAQPGMPRWGELSRCVRSIDRGELPRMLDELLAAGELHERPMDNGHGAGLFPGPPPAEWEPGPPISADELRAMRDWAGLTIRELAECLHAGSQSIVTWERGRKPVPAYRRAQLRRILAERKPPAPPQPAAAEVGAERRRVGRTLRAERLRAGWNQSELAELVGVTQTTVSQWERGGHVVPESSRERLRELFAAAPTAPRVSGSELRRWRRAHGLSSQALAYLFGVARPTVVDWQQRGVPRERAEAVRAALEAGPPAQGSLLEA